jgi:hypothetical protein
MALTMAAGGLLCSVVWMRTTIMGFSGWGMR